MREWLLCNFYVYDLLQIDSTHSHKEQHLQPHTMPFILHITLGVPAAAVDKGIKKSNGGDSPCYELKTRSLSLVVFGAGCGKEPNYFYREIASQTLCLRESCLFAGRASAAGGKGLNLNTFCAKRDYSAAPISPITLAQSYLLEKEQRVGRQRIKSWIYSSAQYWDESVGAKAESHSVLAALGLQWGRTKKYSHCPHSRGAITHGRHFLSLFRFSKLEFIGP